MAKLYTRKSDGTYVPYNPQSVTNIDVVQTTGNSVTAAMSQDAVTKELATKQNTLTPGNGISIERSVISSSVADVVDNIVNAGYVFAGVATPTTDPGTPDAKVFYIANGKGTYTNFGGLKVTEDDVVVLYWDSSWHKEATGIASQAKLSELSTKTMSVQYPDLIDVTNLFVKKSIRDSFVKISDNFAPTLNNIGKYCAIFMCKVGSKFEISNLKGASGARAWAKYDKRGKLLSTADANVTINDTLIMEHDGFLLLNHYGDSDSVFSVKTDAPMIPINAIVGLRNLREEFESFKNEIPQVVNEFGIDNSKAISQSFFTEVIYPLIEKIDLTQQSEAGYMKTIIGTAPSIVDHASRRHIILDVQKGDLFLYDAMGGSSGRSIAYVKDGIVTYVSKDGAIKSYVVADGSYDQIIFNYDSSRPATIVKLGTTIVIPQNESKMPLEGKNIVIFGDSSTAGSASSGTNWFNRMCEDLGAENYRNYAAGGQTILNQEGVSTNYLKASIESAIANINSQWGGRVDVIMLQIGGNDMGHLSEIGSAEDAFSSYNYLTYKDDKTIYGSLRYCLELLRRTYPKALITMGTVFGRLGSNYDGNAKEINDVIKTCCDAMKIQLIDGGKYMGFSPFTEVSAPYYNDGNPNVANDRSALSRENPAYNFINDATGEIVTYDVATNGGVLKSGYSKRYGLYTYDGKHQTKEGEDKVMKFMSNELKKIVE